MVWFINFKKSEHISVNDRGFSYGDGVFETMLFQNGVIKNFEYHRSRLKRALRRLQFDLHDANDLHNIWTFICENASVSEEPVLVKLIITRGEGGRGYMPPDENTTNIAIYFGLAPDYKEIAEKGVEIGVSRIPTSTNPCLAGLKHLNKLENVMAKKFMKQSVFEELMLDPQGHIVECIQSNVGWFKNNILCLPTVLDSGVQGTARSQILDTYDGVIEVARFRFEDIMCADEVFVCNGLMGVVPVTALYPALADSNTRPGDWVARDFKIGLKTRHLQNSFSN